MNKFITDLFTESDGQSWCPARIGLAIGVVSFVAMALYDLYVHSKFDPKSYGEGFSLITAGGGVGIFAKGKVE